MPNEKGLSSSRSEMASASQSPAEGLAILATNSMLENHGRETELPCESMKDRDRELKACVERSAASRMQMRKWETSTSHYGAWGFTHAPVKDEISTSTYTSSNRHYIGRSGVNMDIQTYGRRRPTSVDVAHKEPDWQYPAPVASTQGMCTQGSYHFKTE
ncbi:predicted protein [Postia placenta Mad-698-R]|nr:predicted protein [Postia placenta Mad-698-R]